MDKKDKKGPLHKPQFLYLDESSIAPKDYQQLYLAAASQKEQDVPRSLEFYNDLIVSLLDSLPSTNHFFNVPLVNKKATAVVDVKKSEAYKKSLGTYGDLLQASQEEKKLFDSKLNALSQQKYALLQLLVKAEDAHGNNILVSKNNEGEMILTPINYSRCLAHNFDSVKMIPRTTRWESWPALAAPLLPEVKTFILEKEPQAIVKEVKESFFHLFKEELSDEQELLFEAKFTHLEANMTFVQEAAKRGLTLKQMVALIIPEIDKFSFNYVTNGVLEGGELWPARTRFTHLPTSFKQAWNQARNWSGFSMEMFKIAIINEIERIKKMAPQELEERYFQEICFELRRAIFL